MSNRILWVLIIIALICVIGNAFLLGYLYCKTTYIQERPPTSRIIGNSDYELNSYEIIK
jgi:hypothetical protein